MARDDPKRRRTPPERSGAAICPRDDRGRLQPLDALQRFASKCQFDAVTGCVVWVGGKTRGRGNTAQYGSFWYEGQRWFAHRWAGAHIHGLRLDGVQAGHTCANTLCVQHVVAQSQAENLAEMHGRRARKVEQSNDERRYWLLVELGYEQMPDEHEAPADDIPFLTPPEWLRPFLAQTEETDECPF